MNHNNNRSDAIRKIIALCDLYNLSHEYDQHQFRITLPSVEPMPITRPSFNRDTQIASTWTLEPDPNHVPDELPLPEEPLTEGETPEETEEQG